MICLYFNRWFQKAALKETKETLRDEKRLEELNQLKEKSEIHKIKRDFIEGMHFTSNLFQSMN